MFWSLKIALAEPSKTPAVPLLAPSSIPEVSKPPAHMLLVIRHIVGSADTCKGWAKHNNEFSGFPLASFTADVSYSLGWTDSFISGVDGVLPSVEAANKM